ncbi:signal peptide peptidase SppA [Marivirga arenosa]|uniref:Signal peptide peptidase SppA n=1 Tax=Marivirga arenosa TaxID=3059076 RepID=A0AA51RCY6_9BACT|nr:signal peptide peptidase SppA [Marivirga sp. ABR2-2]WMN07114.1 signal peptide peptidase SppA [Marivirga sp. ABR2-2]
MKSFFKIFFASLLALLVFFFGFFFLFAGIASQDNEIKVSENSFLELNLNRPIVEMTSDDPFAELSQTLANEPSPISLTDILESIEHAKNDDKIKGIYLDAPSVMAGFAQVEEIRNALIDFKESGKPILAYSEIYSETGYYLVSVADDIILNPAGMLEMNGLVSEVTFFKGTFEKLNIEPQIFRVGTFKSAVEPFLRKDMSEASKKQMNELLNSVYGVFIKNIAESRGIDPTELRVISDEYKVRTTEDALDYKLVTKLGYYDEVLTKMREIAGLEEDAKIPVISVKKYSKSFVADKYNSNRIAVIVAEGNIVSGKGGEGSIGSDVIAKEIRKARLDDKIKAIVLRINSPGGSALASDVMWREVKLAKEVKPIIASMSSVAASGGYYMAMACDTIVAQPNTITGSIGIFSIIPDLSKFMDSKLGITFDRVSTGEYSDLYTVSRSLNDAEKQIIQNMVEEGYEDFTSKAAEGRNMDIDDLLAVASGRVWSGIEAKDKGLVDVLGGFDEAVNIAAQSAGLEEGDYMKVYYPEKKPFIQQLLEEMGTSAKLLHKKYTYGEMAQYVEELEYVMENKGLQTRMPFDLEIK